MQCSHPLKRKLYLLALYDTPQNINVDIMPYPGSPALNRRSKHHSRPDGHRLANVNTTLLIP